jgi:aspartyl-tRNA(Asn)/glutamyl-tRNA(Gln) amidotransferase subunit B
MEEGSMRCDVNVSIRPEGSKEFGVKTEIKNLNSIANVMKAVDYEVERQKQLILSGGQVEQETRRFDEATKTTVLMRKKTSAVDYKYFTEPNILPIHLDKEWVKKVQASVPELPDARKARYVGLGLTEYDASVIVVDKAFADYFERVVAACNQPKLAANWMIGSVQAILNKSSSNTLDNLKFSADQLGALIKMVSDGIVSSKQAKEIFDDMAESGKNPSEIAKVKNMMQISDTSLILGWVTTVLDANPQAIETYKSGRQNILGFLVGQVLKMSQGKANPALVNQMLREEIAKR